MSLGRPYQCRVGAIRSQKTNRMCGYLLGRDPTLVGYLSYRPARLGINDKLAKSLRVYPISYRQQFSQFVHGQDPDQS